MPSPNADETLSSVDLSELPDVQLPAEVVLPETLPADETTTQTVTTLDKLPEMPKLSEYVTGQLLPSYANSDINVPEEAPALSDPSAIYWPSQEIAEPAGPSGTLLSGFDSAPELHVPEWPTTTSELPASLPEPSVIKEDAKTPGFSAVLSASHYGPTTASHTFTVPVPNSDELPTHLGVSDMRETEEPDHTLPLLKEIAEGVRALKPETTQPPSRGPSQPTQYSSFFELPRFNW